MNEFRMQHQRVEDESTHDEQELTCPECDGAKILTDVSRGETVCQECGAVIDERVVDHGPEWRAYDDDTSRQRAGAPTTKALHDKGLTTTIDWRNKDSSGNVLSPRRREQFYRLRSWQERIRVRDASERNLQLALNEINRMSSALGVADQVRDMAAVIYRRALDEDMIRGRSIEGIASASMYAACRQNSIPKNLSEVAGISRVEEHEIGRAYRYLVKQLDLRMQPVSPNNYVPRLCSELDLSEAVQRQANEILDAVTPAGLHSGKSPSGFAGAAVYLAAEWCDEERYQSEVANAATVTDVTIRTHFSNIEEYLEQETDREIPL